MLEDRRDTSLNIDLQTGLIIRPRAIPEIRHRRIPCDATRRSCPPCAAVT